MEKEKSCGAVLYTREGDAIKFLIVKSLSGHVSFPKGHVDGNESEEETARREIAEETGLAVPRFEGRFRERFDCVTEKGNEKEIVYFLAEFPPAPVTPADGELTDCWLLPLEKALALITTPEERGILTRAAAFIGGGQ